MSDKASVHALYSSTRRQRYGRYLGALDHGQESPMRMNDALELSTKKMQRTSEASTATFACA